MALRLDNHDGSKDRRADIAGQRPFANQWGHGQCAGEGGVMAYKDYIHCGQCDVKFIYDRYDNVLENLKYFWGVQIEILCPKCVAELRARIAELEQLMHAQYYELREECHRAEARVAKLEQELRKRDALKEE